MGMIGYNKQKNILKIKKQFFNFLDSYKNFFTISISNTSSKQLLDARKCLRDKAKIIVFKKSTLRCLLKYYNFNKKLKLKKFLLNELSNNIAFVATNFDLMKINKILNSLFKPAFAKVGDCANKDIWIKKGSTKIDPSYTTFFQTLGIPTKITKGSIEVLNNIVLIKKNCIFNKSQVDLLSKLQKKP